MGMRLGRSKRFAAGIGAAVLLSGGAGALAATQLGSNPRQVYLNDVASRLHVTPTALTSAMKAARIDQINAAQKAGKLTAAQAKAAKRSIRTNKAARGLGAARGLFGGPPGAGNRFGGPPGFRGRGHWKGFGPGGGHGAPACGGPSASPNSGTTTTSTSTTATPMKSCAGPAFWSHEGGGPGPAMRFRRGLGLALGLFGTGARAAMSYLGITAGTLRSDLASGKTLAQIASGTSGKSLSGMESAVQTAIKAQLDKAVAAGQISAAREAKVLSKLPARLSKLVNRAFKMLAPMRMLQHAPSP